VPIAFSLGREERIVILDRLDTGKLDEFFVARLKKTERDAARVNFELTREAFEEFAQALGAAVQQGSKQSRDEILFVMHSIDQSIHETGESAPTPEPLPAPRPGSPADQLAKEAAVLIKERGAETIDEVNAILKELQDAYNHKPQARLGGLAPYEAHRLFNPNWSDPKAGIQLREDLPFEAIAHTPMLFNTRLLLTMLDDAGGAKATPNGYLNTKFTGLFAERMMTDDKYHLLLLNEKSRWREEEVRFLSELRFIAELGGLMRKYKGAFQTTKKGRQMLDEDSAGALYALLFRTLFQRLNLACFDGFPEMPALQDTIAFSLHGVHTHARDWISKDELSIHLFMPEVHADMPIRSFDGESYAPIAGSTRVLTPLRLFGLLEIAEADYKVPESRTMVRVTPLFDQFLSFHLEDLSKA